VKRLGAPGAIRWRYPDSGAKLCDLDRVGTASRVPRGADTHLAEATETAARTGTNFAHLFFGPGNVDIWRCCSPWSAARAVRPASSQDRRPGSLPASGERRSAFYLDLGRGMATEKVTRDQAVVALRRAEEIAPQRIRTNPFVREIVVDLLRRARRDAGGRDLRGMVYRMGISASGRTW
jgi:hypothetical protein